MKKITIWVYGLVVYLVFLATFLYAIEFVADVLVPKGINGGDSADTTVAVLINVALLGLFAVQHSVMARQGFKKWWTRIVPSAAERSTYVLLASLILVLLFWQWRPLPASVWHVESETGRLVLWGAFWTGWATVLVSTFLINHFDLFGLRQVWLNFSGKNAAHPEFKTTGLYRHIRHPIMLGFVVAFWATPDMSVGHLIFAVATTGYILIGIFFEERDLRKFHGERYARYQQEVPMLIPVPKIRRTTGPKPVRNQS